LWGTVDTYLNHHDHLILRLPRPGPVLGTKLSTLSRVVWTGARCGSVILWKLPIYILLQVRVLHSEAPSNVKDGKYPKTPRKSQDTTNSSVCLGYHIHLTS
jgi:hypothetical protein